MQDDWDAPESFDDTGVPLSTIILGSKCPRCGAGPLYEGFLTLYSECPGCQLDYGPIDSGDGPAIFVIFIVGFAVTFAALAVEVNFSPPYWLHLVLWIPAILIGSFALLRPIKNWLIAQQYRTKAREGSWPDQKKRPEKGAAQSSGR